MTAFEKQNKAYQVLIDVFEKDLWINLPRDKANEMRLTAEDKRLMKVYANKFYDKVLTCDYPYSLLFDVFYHKMPLHYADFVQVAQQIRKYYQEVWLPAQDNWQVAHLVYHNYFKTSRYMLAYYPRKRQYRFGETTATMTAQWTHRLEIIDSHADNLVKLVQKFDDDIVAKLLMWRLIRNYSPEAFDDVEQPDFSNEKMSALCSEAHYSSI